MDITGDQFKYNRTFDCFNNPVYVGSMNGFHRYFDVRNADVYDVASIFSCDSSSLNDYKNEFANGRLVNLYNIIQEYL